ncbi:MAG: PhoH family protein [Pirellulaceae bacterium]|nr:PhoH family protein [Pirellulaceae bacterium]
MFEATVSLAEPQQVLSLFGTRDQHLRRIRDELGVSIIHRDGEIRVSGDEAAVTQATAVLEQLKGLVQRRGALASEDVSQVLGRITGNEAIPAEARIEVLSGGQLIRARTQGQARYVEAVRRHDLTFAVGPAGSGKTYLAVALAVEAFKNRQIRKIVLVRPAVEAGESLGFLPGDLQAKINPYLRPLLDALHEMIAYDQMRQLMEQDLIEVIPLAYMRGRTLNQAFIILDEAQNTTVAQMKMFLTRMGEQSKIVVAGDTTQVDLPKDKQSGLVDAVQRLRRIRGVCEVNLTKADIVRHRLVSDIVHAYEERPTRSGPQADEPR